MKNVSIATCFTEYYLLQQQAISRLQVQWESISKFRRQTAMGFVTESSPFCLATPCTIPNFIFFGTAGKGFMFRPPITQTDSPENRAKELL